jgi:hypothetical protein
MKMNEPYLALYVNNGVLRFTKKLPTESRPRDILEVGVSEITSDKFDEAAKKLGSTALGILSLWHRDAFQDWGIPSDEKKERNRDFDLAVELIGKSVAGKTKAHVLSIDFLLRQAAIKSDSAQSFLNESWPSIRARLDSYFGGPEF